MKYEVLTNSAKKLKPMSKKLLNILFLLAGFYAHSQTTMNIYQNNGTVLQIPLSIIDSINYTISNSGNLPLVNTLSVSNIGISEATINSSISSDGGTTITKRGVCYSVSSVLPTTANSITVDGVGTGNYVSILTGLQSNTIYYVRAYATNSTGTSYGKQFSFTTGGTGNISVLNNNLTYGSVSDQEGNIYPTIIIGTQEWMAENLRVSTYSNGDPIPNITDGSQWASLSSGAWAYYNNDTQYNYPYGKLYNWFTVVDVRNICPIGWRVPTDIDWNALIGYLDSDYYPNSDDIQSTIAGGKMKSTGTNYWFSNVGATNESGFSGIRGGFRSQNGAFLLSQSNIWSSSLHPLSGLPLYRSLNNSNSNIYRFTNTDKTGMAVRCLR